MKHLYNSLVSGLIFFFLSTQLLAQSADSSFFRCGIAESTLDKKRELVQLGKLALQRKLAAGAAFNAITYVPIRPHLFRKSDGSGGYSLDKLNMILALSNKSFLNNGYGIQFYLAGETPDYINDTYLDENFPHSEGNTVNGRDATNALNLYIMSYFVFPGPSGYAYYPSNELSSTRIFIAHNNFDFIEPIGPKVLPHELGHVFILIHTYGNNNATTVTTELVTRGAGANCTTDGDLLCDTPADPFGNPEFKIAFPNACPAADLNSTARDANGERYWPSFTNLMSYYNYQNCGEREFTAGQYERMQEGLALRQSHTAYSLNAPPTPVLAPSNVRLSANGNLVTVTWQDNASNEMGYLIERSTSPTAGFMAVGGVAPNVTSYADNSAPNAQRYYYRIRPSNTTTGSLSPVVDVNLPGLVTVVISASVQLSWPVAYSGALYEVQFRPLGSPTWTSRASLSQTTILLGDLDNNVTYEWRVRTMDSNEYAGPVTFTIPCLAPNFLYATPGPIAANLDWIPMGGGQTFSLRWRTVGEPNWSTIGLSASKNHVLTGLQPSTTYEWQVQSVCSPTVSSGYGFLNTFSTTACQSPGSLAANNITGSSANLSWSFNTVDVGIQTELRYRRVGTSDWTTVSGLTVSNYGLSGLAGSTQYEWQVRAVCTAASSTDFSASSLFQTPAYCEMYTPRSGSWSDMSLWSCGRVPLATDVVHLKHAVTIPENYQATANRLIYDAPVNLNWLRGSRLRLSK